MPDAEDGSRTPKQADQNRPKSKGNSSIDPALRGEEDKSSSGTPAARSEVEDKRQEEWVENIRVIEALRNWIGERLRNGEFEEQQDQSPTQQQPAQPQHEPIDVKPDAQAPDSGAVETAKMVEEKMADALASSAEAAATEGDNDVKYPSLPTA